MTRDKLAAQGNRLLDGLEFAIAWATAAAIIVAICTTSITIVDSAQLGMLWLILDHLWRKR